MFLIKIRWPQFGEPQLCRSHIYIIAIVKFCNRSVQSLFIVNKGTCMNSCKLASLRSDFLNVDVKIVAKKLFSIKLQA